MGSTKCWSRFLKSIAVVVAVSFVSLPTGVMAQSTAQISGVVTDQSSAILPGVEVKVTQTDTGITRSAVTNETGSYTLPNLPIGPYRLEAALPGFRSYVRTGIVLQVGSNPVLNILLEVGQVSESVEVQADASLVETRNTGISQMIDNTRVLELPLNGRQVTELVLLSGVATTSTQGTLNPGSRNYPTIIIQVAGGMQAGLTYRLDGTNHNDAYNNLNLPLPFPDALQEFKVETSGLAAQYGFHSSGAVNAVTKAGTNEYHGDLFEFLRNGAANARNAFALTNDGLKRNQFGGTVGGPIIRNKLFFFAGEQRTTERSRPSANRAYIPTPAMLAGDFTTIASPGCNAGKAIPLRAPFANNRIDPSQFSKVALNLVHHQLFPTTNDPCGEVRFGSRNQTNEWISTGRMDYQLNTRHSLFGRFFDAHRDQPADYDGQNVLTSANGHLVQNVHSFALGETYLISPTAVSSFHGSVNWSYLPKFAPKTFDLTSLGAKGVYDGVPDMTVMTVNTGFSLLGTNTNPGHQNTTSYHLGEDLTIERGRHQLGLGVSWIHQMLNGSVGSSVFPATTFDGHFTGLGLSDFMLGKASAFVQGSPVMSNTRQNSIGVYIQDTWKASSRLTVSPGLRWEPHTLPYHLGRPMHFEREWFDKGIKSTVFKNAPAGLQYTGDALYPGFNTDVENSWLKFAPRLGLAWDVSGNGRTETNPSIFIPGTGCVLNGQTFSPCSTTGNTNQRRVLNLANPAEGQYFANITTLGDESTASYNGMLLTVQRRRSKGVTVQANYTWSHCIADPFAAGGSQTSTGVFPGRRLNERAGCPGDTRHSINGSVVYETPQFSGRLMRLLASAWQVSGIARIQSGTSLAVTSGFNTSLGTGFGIDRANQVLADPYLPNKGVNGWLNPAAFARPADGVWGNASQNIQGTGFITLNMGLTRKFRMSERQSVEFRAEAFNMPNHLNPNNPVLALNSKDFGKILSAGDPRIMQFALKYLF